MEYRLAPWARSTDSSPSCWWALSLSPSLVGCGGGVAHPGGLAVRYEVLGTAIDPAPAGTCPTGMVRLPGGQPAGEHGGGGEPFCMDVSEVTVGAYSACVSSRRCQPAPTTAKFEGITDELRAKWNPT